MRHIYSLKVYQCCTLFLSFGFVPLGFPSKVFNEAINNIILQIKIDENIILFFLY
ncbi:hypothetical protein Scep_014366 [Stephania cephalantha]|uniref:Uncharacterized protein n=1 Tax=Stephania cephalantha TaxID=152367 RepID=A0AAP0J2F4_9MAGN